MAKPSRVFAAGELVEIRYLPGEKQWERAVYVRRRQRDEMPSFWLGPLGHVVHIARLGRDVCITGHRIRKTEAVNRG